MLRRAPPRLVVTTLYARASASSRSTARSAPIPHAFGGAIALAYYAEPRATIDIDLNLFVPAERFPDVAAPLARLGAAADDPHGRRRDSPRRPGARDVGRHAHRPVLRVRRVPRRGRRGPPHGARSPTPRSRSSRAEHLVVCKVCSTAPKDWVDIDAIVDAGRRVDVAEVLRWVGRIAGDDDPRYDRIAAVLAQQALTRDAADSEALTTRMCR